VKSKREAKRAPLVAVLVLIVAATVPGSAVAVPTPPASVDAWYAQLLDEAGFRFTEVGMGRFHACAIRTDGSLHCWGANDAGQLDHPGGAFLDVASGQGHTCGVRGDGTVACWGSNALGQANGIPPGPFVLVEAGGDQTCALTSAGALSCWGWNASGFPDGTFVDVAVGDGGNGRCAVRTTGTLACWGGLIGGATPPSGSFVDVSVGSVAACAVRTTGELACWGHDNFAQLSAPQGAYAHVTVGYGVACATDAAGSASCWGAFMDPSIVPTESLSHVAVGAAVACGLDEDELVTCFGTDSGNGIVDAPRTRFSTEVVDFVRDLQGDRAALATAPACSFRFPQPGGSRSPTGKTRLITGWVEDDAAVGTVEVSIFNRTAGVYIDAAGQLTATETWLNASIAPQPDGAAGRWRQRLVRPPAGTYEITCRTHDWDGNAGIRPVHAPLTIG
jgi:hypothetical protein